MVKKISNILTNLKKYNKFRTINLALFLILLISLPLILNTIQKKQNLKQYAQIVPQGILPVYGVYANVLDSLKSGWTATILYGGPTAYDLYNKAPVYSAPNSIAYTVTAPWDELHLVAPGPVDISPYIWLTFYVQAASPGMRFAVVLLGADGKAMPSPAIPVPMDQYGGLPSTTGWTIYNIPITAFNAPTKSIYGIGFMDLNGGTQAAQPPPPIYIDEINFSVSQGQDLPPMPGAAQISGPSVIPTPMMPYYPDISPWVYIIPGMIILAAMIFQ